MRNLIIILLFLYTVSIFAIVDGSFPSEYKKFSVFGSVVVGGNTMMAASPPGNVNDILLTENSGDITGIPYDAEIEGAYLFWTGSTNIIPDNNVYFEYVDGYSTFLTADSCATTIDMGGFFYCKKDVTTELKQHRGTLNYNGSYTLGSLDAQAGDCNYDPYLCQAKYAAWSIVIVYKSNSATTKRDIVLYDSFLHLDEHEDSIGITQFDIGGFLVGNPVVAELTYFGLEGDSFLGVPPQDRDPNYPCPNCYDFISLNNKKLFDSRNPQNNIWNSTLALGVDIDTFNIGASGLNILTPNQTSTTIRLGSGDGIIPNDYPEAGGGESVFLGFIVLGIDTLSPNFRTSRTNLVVDRSEASQGDSLTYIVTVTNDGSQLANNVIIKNAIPANVEYIPGSTFIDGTAAGNDNIATLSGLGIGSIDYRGTNRKIITFRVKVNNNVANGTHIYNTVTITSNETRDDPTVTNKVDTIINSPILSTPILQVRDENGGSFLPGDWVEYTARIINSTNNPIGNIIFYNQLPLDNFKEFQLTSSPFNSVDESDITNGIVKISNIEVPARGVALIKYRARIKTIDEFITDGVSEDQINNKLVSTQGYITTPAFLPQTILTDNDNGGNEHNPTTFTITKAVNADFSQSSMIVVNNNGTSIYKPGDTVLYTLNIKNSANARVDGVNVVVNINSAYFEDISVNTGSFDGSQVKWLINSINSNETKQLTFSAKIKKPQLNGTLIQNQGIISIPGYSTVTDDLTTPANDDPTSFIITSQSNFITSTKTYVDENGGNFVQPNDIVIYTIKLINTGDGSGNSLIVDDILNTNLTFIEGLNGAVYDNATRKITWSYLNNPALQNVSSNIELKVKVKVNAGLPNGTVISNQASIKSIDNPRIYYSDDPTTSSPNDSTKFTVNSKGELSESYKTYEDLNGGDIEPGDSIRYTIQVRNTGTEEVTNVKVEDNVDLTYLENIIPEDGGILAGNKITWVGGTLINIPANSEILLHFTAKLKSPLNHNTEIINQASISSDQYPYLLTDDPNTSVIDDATKFKVVSLPEVIFTKNVTDINGGDFEPGDNIKYNLIITNSNKSSTGNIVITDTLPSQITNISATNGGIIEGQKITWYLPPLDVNGNIILEITGNLISNISNNYEICNQGDLFDENYNYNLLSDDLNKPNENDKTCFNVKSNIKISNFYKTFTDLNGGEIRPNDIIQYTLSFQNSGTVPVINLEITDNIDGAFSDITLDNGGTYNGTSVSFNALNTPVLAQILPGETKNISFKAKLKTPLTNNLLVSNQATLFGESLAPLLSDNPLTTTLNDLTTFNVKSNPIITFEKTVINTDNSTVYNPEDEIFYTLKIKNSGDDFAKNIEISDLIPSNLTIISAQNGNISGNQITWNNANLSQLSNLAPNENIEIQIRCKINNNAVQGTQISNQATLNYQNGTQILSDNPNTVTLNDPTIFIVTENANITFTKTVANTNGESVFKPSDIIEYSLNIKNNNSALVQIEAITDPIDLNLENITITSGNGTINGNLITFNNVIVQPNLTTTLKFTAKIKDSTLNNTNISNQALLDYGIDSMPTVPSDNPGTPDLNDPTSFKVTKTNYKVDGYKAVDRNITAYKPGDVVTYKLKFQNITGSSVNSLFVYDPVSPYLSIFSISHGGVFQNGNVEWTEATTPELAVFELYEEIEFTVMAYVNDNVTDGMIIENQARYNYNFMNREDFTDDPFTPDVDDSTKIKVGIPDLTLSTKEVIDETNDGIFSLNERVTYKLIVKNNSQSVTATNVEIKDSFPFEQLNLDPNQNMIVDFGVKKIKFDKTTTPQLEQLAPNQFVEIYYTATIKESLRDGEIIENQATISYDGKQQNIKTDDPKTSEIDDSTKFIVTAKPDLTNFEKSVVDLDGNNYFVGDRIKYILKTENTGSSSGKNLIIKDIIDTRYLEIIEAENGEINGNTVTFSYLNNSSLIDFAPSQTALFTITVKIKNDILDGTKIDNQANISGQNVLIEPSDNPETTIINDATSFTVTNKSILTGDKKAIDLNGDFYQAGDVIRYQIKIYNKGIVDSINTIFYDYVPQNTEYVLNSTKVNGTNIADIEDNPPFINGLNLGTVVKYDNTDNTVKIIEFDVKISDFVTEGTTISNQGNFTNSTNISNVTDDPETPEINDETIIYIGDKAVLKDFYKFANLIDENSNDIADVGETIEYKFELTNKGSKSNKITIEDSIPVNTNYINESIVVDDISQSDINDEDKGYFDLNNNKLIITLNGLEKNQITTFGFKVRITANENNKVENQAILKSDEITEPSDNDYDETNGNGITTTYIGNSQEVKLEAIKNVTDLNGGYVLPNDELTYEIIVTNKGNQEAVNVQITDLLPKHVEYIRNSEVMPNGAKILFEPGLGDSGKITFSNFNVKINESLTFKFNVKVKEKTESGTRISNIANILGDNFEIINSTEAIVIAGGIVGTTQVAGNLYFLSQNKEKNPLTDFTVKIFQLNNNILEEKGAVKTDENGYFNIYNIQPGYYTLKYFSDNDVEFGAVDLGYLIPQIYEPLNITFKPTGIIYDSKTKKPLQNTKVYLYYDDLLLPPESDCEGLILAENLPYNQQGQILDKHGFYYFNFPKNAKLRICANAGNNYVFPSTLKTPNEEAVEIDEDGFVVSGYNISIDGNMTDSIAYNNIPLDGVSKDIVISKTVNKKEVSTGGIVSYSVKVENKSKNDFSIDENSGVYIEDILPNELKLVNGSFTAKVIENGKIRQFKISGVKQDKKVMFGPFNFESGDSIQVDYRAVVSSKAKVGKHINRAILLNQDNIAISDVATAVVKVVEDYDFDIGTIIGKVYCDDNNNQIHDIGEEGLPGAIIYSDEGFSSQTDKYGKFHFSAVTPGFHLFKIDKNTLVSGYEPLEERRSLFVTNGLFAKINFPVKCLNSDAIVETKKEETQNGKIHYDNLVFLTGKLSEKIYLNNEEIKLTKLNIEVFPEVILEEDATITIPELPLNSIVNFYIYNLNDKNELNEIVYKEQTANNSIKTTLKPGHYVVYAEIINDSGIFTTPFANLMVQFPQDKENIEEFEFEKLFTKGILNNLITEKFDKTDFNKVVEFNIYAKDENLYKKLQKILKENYKLSENLIKFNKLEEKYKNDAKFIIKYQTLLDFKKVDFNYTEEINLNDEKIEIGKNGKIFAVFNKQQFDRYNILVRTKTGHKNNISFINKPKKEIKNLKVVYDDEGIKFKNNLIKLNIIKNSIKQNENNLLFEYFDDYTLSNLNINLFKNGEFVKNITSEKVTDKKLLIEFNEFENISYSLSYNIIPESYFKNLILPNIESMFVNSAELPLNSNNEITIAKILLNKKELIKGENSINFENNKGIIEIFYSNGNILTFILKFNNEDFNIEQQKEEIQLVSKEFELFENNDIGEVEYDNFGKDNIKVSKVEIKTYKDEFGLFKLMLPPENSEIKTDKIFIKGKQPEGSIVTINGEKTKPDKFGVFVSTIEVTKDLNKIEVKLQDKNGNLGEIIRNIKISDSAYFFMALAESSIGYQKASVDDKNYVAFGDDRYYLHARGVVYAKGYVKGEKLKKYVKGFFEEVKATGYIDSGKNSEFEEYYLNLINPEKFYPVYGDSSKETQDIQSMGKVYVKIEADKSSVLWGNYNSNVLYSDLIVYDKTLYGASLKFDKKTGVIDNKINMFYSGNELTSKTLYNEFLGTGGSLYYLQSSMIKEGTESVKIVVRDRDSNIELFSKYLVLNTDYTVNYASGTILLKEPLPSHVDSQFITSGKLDYNSMMGHPVYLSVSYQSDGIVNIDGESTFGVSLKETFKDKYFITANYITENRNTKVKGMNDYSIMGFGTGYNYSETTKAFFEYAQSNNIDNASYLSENGGITFEAFNASTKDVSGNAYKFEGSLNFGDFVQNKLLKSLKINTVYQYADNNFYSQSNRNEFGGHKIGVLTSLQLDENQSVKVNYSGVISDLEDELQQISGDMSKHLVTLHYDNKLTDKIGFIVEHQAGYISDFRKQSSEIDGEIVENELVDEAFITNVTSAFVTYKLFDNLTLFGQQDVIENYDKRDKYFEFGDRFTTTVGGEYSFTEKFSALLSESVKYSGDNSTNAGVKYRLAENSSIYVSEKFNNEQQQKYFTTIFGGESQFGKDNSYKLYGEYQLDSGTTVEQSRALMGLGKTFKINKNLGVQAGFEHTFYKTEYGNDRQGDALSFAMNYNLPEQLLLFTKHELRYDEIDKTRFHYLTSNGGQYQFGYDLTFLFKFNYFVTDDLTNERIEAEMMEGSIGFAFRPFSYDFLNVITKYSIIKQFRPLSLLESDDYKEFGHVLSVAGIYEFPFKVQFTEKLVVKYATVETTYSEQSEVITMLWINRLSYHFANKFDVATEYRLRKIFDYDTTSGFLFELTYQFKKHMGLGMGYNFTSFNDSVFYMNDNDAGGFFVRINGTW